ncbi:Putative stomatin/prohibitin-family membrane protease subunit YbbK [Lentimonas sp. CC4]|uniref:SPFH domain-containing protein n=2 Tax=unclassified Lentimonas TaxID=2630993 RepID=UPI001326D6B1|nr:MULTISPECIES: SPFH domain-containing protein [unclassified Lentimonas]CAA6685319.1 Putative stomatin/prohibitin-family membrane protease subunit YbbK [Lentimonas sp. CC6]CAA7168354.1 Putative stomatin/prohibitin-family membrane protease subunit YbbK [Lentimonas sp. CC21]CAA6676479.1 Putative stomatin/prohibitin-family membrane protease subunit YbbK [Lentimonas sp. CC4]CAA7074957.1 Putative stomatin/prohibitin-family membrane protease subunit YbbK [Lentimonas sp. CC4]CAA7180598.1 Putative st
MEIVMIVVGIALAAALVLALGVYTVGPTERAVLTSFGRAQRIGNERIGDDPELGPLLTEEEKKRYDWPVVRVIKPGGPYFKWPWQKLTKVDMTIQTTDIIWDPDIDQDAIDSVTKDNLTVEISGQIRWRPCERNLYAYVFGVRAPRAHIMGYFISVLRDRIATFSNESEIAVGVEVAEGISINDLRKNLSSINQYMEESCVKTAVRYGIELDAALITTIDPPSEVDEALASINTTSNNVAAEISQAKAEADQTLKMAEQAVQIAENQANAEAAPLLELSETLTGMYANGGREALDSYLRNASLPLREKASQTIVTLNSTNS